MRVVVLGAGALGSVYGAWLADAGADVTLVARRPHAEAIRDKGLEVRAYDADTKIYHLDATDDPAAAGDADLVVVGAKSFDVPPLLAAYTGRASMAFSVQNGVDQAVPLLERFGSAAVEAVSMVGGTLVGPGVAAYTFAGATYVGDVADTAPGTAARIAAALPERIAERADIASVPWTKASLAAAAMGVVALTRSIYHRMFITPALREVFLDLLCEVALVAHSEGVQLIDLPGPMRVHTFTTLPRGQALNVLREFGEQLVATGQTGVKVSALQSIERGRPLEVDAVYAPLVRRAAERGLQVPLLAGVTRMMFGIDAAIREDAG